MVGVLVHIRSGGRSSSRTGRFWLYLNFTSSICGKRSRCRSIIEMIGVHRCKWIVISLSVRFAWFSSSLISLAVKLILLNGLDLDNSWEPTACKAIENLVWLCSDKIEVVASGEGQIHALSSTLSIVHFSAFHVAVDSFNFPFIPSQRKVCQLGHNLSRIHISDWDSAIIWASNEMASGIKWYTLS